jgi:hypothetical protein
MEEVIIRDSYVFEMLDHVLRDEPAFWNGLYSDRSHCGYSLVSERKTR